MQFEVTKYANVSTAHMTENDAKLLAKTDDKQPLIVQTYPEGFFVTLVPEKNLIGGKAKLFREMQAYGYSVSLCEVIDHVYCAGIDSVRFDADNPKYPELTTFDW